MLIKSLNRTFVKVAGKAPLRTILIVPFVVQIVGAVGLVGYLSFRNGQQAVNKVASQLRSEISVRISDRISTYLKTPHLINSTNADAIRLAQLDIKNPKSLERHFLKQIQVFDSLSRIYFSNPQGGLISVGNDERGFSVASTKNFASGNLRVQGVDSQGNYKKILVNKSNYDARERPFYKTARDAGRPTWSPIYVYVPSSRGLDIAASYPFYDEAGKLQGVLSSDLSLVAISEFLQNLKVSVQGKAFIIEHSGLLVASSTTELPFLSSADRQEKKRLKATESKEPLIRATAQHLISEFGNLTNINTSKQLEYEIDGQRQLAQVTPFKDEFGLNWLIVVVVPEADFMEQIHANTALSGESSTVDDMDLHRPDRIIPLEVWATPIYDEMGQVAYAIIAFTDITERKQAQIILADYNRTLEGQVAEGFYG
jgi:PAS domain-containing protein